MVDSFGRARCCAISLCSGVNASTATVRLYLDISRRSTWTYFIVSWSTDFMSYLGIRGSCWLICLKMVGASSCMMLGGLLLFAADNCC